MKKILVTGANSQLGQELKILSEESENEFIFTGSDELDITNLAGLNAFIANTKPQVLINCAAYTAVDLAETDKDKATLLNQTAVGYLAALCASANIQLIHFSTDFVFDGQKSSPYTETDQPNPTGHYGMSKWMGEKDVLAKCPSAIIIRTSWLFSPFGKNFLKTMIRLGTERDTLSVVFDQIGTPTYAHHLANAVLAIIDHKGNKQPGGIYHFSNEGVASWFDFAKAIIEIAEVDTEILPVKTTEYPTPAKRPSYSVLDKTKIKERYDLTIPYWRDGLRHCIQRLKY